MASDRQIEANRRNAQKSTGPRTAEGKAKAAGNAIKHGLLSRQIVLDCEDSEEFEAFRAAMVGDLRPAGAVEELMADHAVASAWRLGRVLRMQTERMNEDLARALDDHEDTIAKRKIHSPETLPLRPVTLGRALTRGFSADLPYNVRLMYRVAA